MSTDQYPEPLTEGLLHTGQRLVQIVALAAAAHQRYAQRVQRLKAASEARQAQAERAAQQQLRAEFEQARARWAPAHDPTWLRNATLLDVAEAWGAAVSYAADSATASSAMRKCETRLRDLHPHAMSHYDRFRDEGHDPLDAMRQAAPYFTRDPDVRTGDPSTPRPELAEGSGARWAATIHGPDRSEWEEALREQRAEAITANLRERAESQGRTALPDELRTVLTNTTNLPEHVIAAVSKTKTRPRPSTAAHVAAEDFPHTVDEAMALTAKRSYQAAPRRAARTSIDRTRRRSR